ncbi:MAG: protein phosphatase 2C domain-containing protein [Planctomycetota bacterium]
MSADPTSPPAAPQLPDLRHGAQTDPGKQRLANEDAFAADPRLGLFVVCDGIGGQPSGEAASNLVAHSVAHLLKRGVRRYNRLNDVILKRLLADAVIRINQELYEHSRAIPTLEGMGCTIVGALLDARSAFLFSAGDSRAYLLRDDTLRQLTVDHVRTAQRFVESEAGDLEDAGEKRLLMKFLGTRRPLQPDVGQLALVPGDRLLLCSDGVTDPLEDDAVTDLLRRHDDPEAACAALIDAANAAGGPDNITALVVDYFGPRGITDADRVSPPRTPPELPHNIAQQTHAALDLLEDDLCWLLEGSRESAHPNRLTALAAAKRRLGAEAYRDFLAKHPNQAPLHIFHQACVAPDSPWRQRYAAHPEQLQPPLKRLTGGGIRLSPLLTGDETAAIYGKLWHDWQRVEQRYFRVCQREAKHGREATLDILITHMLNSVRTLGGLFEFLPRYMRDLPAS